MPRFPLPILTLCGVAVLAACQGGEDDARKAPTPTPTSKLPALPVADPPLNREALLLAVIRAASAQSAGVEAPRQPNLDGKRFELRLRFGCAGPVEEGEPRRWTFDEDRRVLRLRAEPDITGAGPALDPFELGPYEGVEGFWIRRPWLLNAVCPPAPAAPEQVEGEDEKTDDGKPAEPAVTSAPAAPRIGIIQLFGEDDVRTHRRRSYQATKLLDSGVGPSTAGYDIVISGRLRRLPDGRVIACRQENPKTPPSCLISAQFDKVALERADTREQIAQWVGA